MAAAASLASLTVAGYRSVRDLSLPLKGINVLVGANGCGKSNLYRAVYLLHAAAEGRFARTLADEGGMPSLLWAGPRRRGPVLLKLEVAFDSGLRYELVCGLPEADSLPNSYQSFQFDPVIKSEAVTFRDPGKRGGAVTLLDRGKSGAMVRDAAGRPVDFPMALSRGESVLAQLAEPHRFPHLSVLRETLRGWRFYHGFRTDEAAPIRQPQVGCFTPALAHDGRDLAAALQTVREIGDEDGLFRAVRQGLAGAGLEILYPPDFERFRLRLHTPGVGRPLEAWELSDGTLRYLCLLAALMSPRPPALLALNEPETSLHPDLLEPLAARIVEAAGRSQLWITTHSLALAEHIERRSGVAPVLLKKTDGETRLG